MTRPTLVGLLLLLAACGEEPEVRSDLAPIIFVSVDTLSARNMSLYGYERKTTPELERLAADAVVFENCRTNAPWTLPSFLSVMTGLYPYAHRLPPPTGGEQVPLWEKWYLAENRWTLAELMRSAGYRTGGFVDQIWLIEQFGFTQGFEEYDSTAGSDFEKEDPEGGIRHTRRLAEEWIEDLREGEPFFAFVHCFDVHGPYHSDEGFAGRFREDELARASRSLLSGGPSSTFGIVHEYVPRSEYPEKPSRVDAARVRSAYDEGLALTDSELGLFFDRLRELGVYDRALIIVSADHGETMADSDLYFGHGTLEGEVLHVPLIVKLPGNERGGTRVEQAVQLVDLYPTVLDFLGAKTKPEFLHGRSLMPLLHGETPAPAVAYSEGGIMRQACVELDGWKLLLHEPRKESTPSAIFTQPLLHARWDAGEFEPATKRFDGKEQMRALRAELDATGLTESLYAELREDPDFFPFVNYLRKQLPERVVKLHYLPDDPLEAVDLSEENPEKVAELLALLEAEQARREEARANADLPQLPPELSAEDIAELGRLGYAEGD